MEKLKKWLNEHKSLIIGLLIVLLLFKNCSSCTQERRYEYTLTEYEQVIDSMQTVIDGCSLDTKDLCDSIYSLRKENELLKNVITDLKEDKNYYRKANKDLVNVTEALTKKDTIN